MSSSASKSSSFYLFYLNLLPFTYLHITYLLYLLPTYLPTYKSYILRILLELISDDLSGKTKILKLLMELLMEQTAEYNKFSLFSPQIDCCLSKPHLEHHLYLYLHQSHQPYLKLLSILHKTYPIPATFLIFKYKNYKRRKKKKKIGDSR